MPSLKKLVFPLISIFLLYRSIELLYAIGATDLGVYGFFGALGLAFLFALLATGVFAFLGFAYPTHRLLPKAYYRVRNPSVLKSLYAGLGLKYFRYFLLVFFWGRKNNRKKYFDGTKKGLDNFVFQTKQSEFGHLGAFLAILVGSAILLFHRHFVLVLALTVLNFFGNLYPIALQRFHRMRIESIKNHKKTIAGPANSP